MPPSPAWLAFGFDLTGRTAAKTVSSVGPMRSPTTALPAKAARAEGGSSSSNVSPPSVDLRTPGPGRSLGDPGAGALAGVPRPGVEGGVFEHPTHAGGGGEAADVVDACALLEGDTAPAGVLDRARRGGHQCPGRGHRPHVVDLVDAAA